MTLSLDFWRQNGMFTIEQISILTIGGNPTDVKFIESHREEISVIEGKLVKCVVTELEELKRLHTAGYKDNVLEDACSDFGMIFYSSLRENYLSSSTGVLLHSSIHSIELYVSEINKWFKSMEMKPIFFFPEADRDKLRIDEESKHQTRLMTIMDETINRYYGENFAPEDKDSYPVQTEIIEWLEKNYALSGRRAEAIEVIIGPRGDNTLEGKK